MNDSQALRRLRRVRRGGRLLIVGAGLATALSAGPSAVRARQSHTPEESGQAAEQVLRRAGNQLGGADRLRAIDRLQITAMERESWRPQVPRGRSYKLWLPDRFQSHVDGIVTHTLNAGHLTIDPDFAPEVRGVAEKAIPATFRRVALAFLLRAPGLSAPRLRGEATIAGLSGIVVEFASAASGGGLKLLLAQTSAHPVAVVFPVHLEGSTEQREWIWRLEDYRVVDGVRFPFRLTIVRPGSEITTEVQQIDVNPRFAAADFPK